MSDVSFTPSKVAAIILAAGSSTRFGQPKQLLDWQGRPLVAHIADTAWVAGLIPTLVVLGAERARIAPVLAGRPVQILTNYRWREGMSTSIAVGLATLPQSVEAAVFLPVDQPLITPAFLQLLVRHWRENSAGIIVPADQNGQRGSPALFTREFFPALARLKGEMGGRALLKENADRIDTIPVQDTSMLADVDTPDAYTRLKARVQEPDMESVLKATRAVIADMDGVLWHGQTPLPGMHDFFTFVKKQAMPYMLVTNNSSRTPEQYVERLQGYGVETTADHVLNSAVAAADYLAEILEPGALIYPIGEQGVLSALQARGFRISEGKEADYVVVGWDHGLTWKKLATATQLIHQGAGFLGTNPDRTFPMETGIAPGTGMQIAALEASTGITPTIVGKPRPILYQRALERMGVLPEETLVIGDRLETDILGGMRLGMKTVVLMSGITTQEILANSPIRPNLIFDNLAALIKAWRDVDAGKYPWEDLCTSKN